MKKLAASAVAAALLLGSVAFAAAAETSAGARNADAWKQKKATPAIGICSRA